MLVPDEVLACHGIIYGKFLPDMECDAAILVLKTRGGMKRAV